MRASDHLWRKWFEEKASKEKDLTKGKGKVRKGEKIKKEASEKK